MKRKIFTLIFSIISILVCVVALSACGIINTDGGTPAHTEHKYADSVVPPTCEEQGYTLHKCACGDEYKDSFVAASGHSFTAYTYNNDATCVTDGTETAKCDNCTETFSRTKENTATGIHSFTNYVYDGNATCANDGTETAKCEDCAVTHSRQKENTALPHEYSGHVCKLCYSVDPAAPVSSELEFAPVTENGVITGYSVSMASGASESKYIKIPETHDGMSVCKIGDNAFQGREGLLAVDIPSSVTAVGNRAFEGCVDLVRIRLSSSVTIVGNRAFDGCKCLVVYCEAASASDGWVSSWNVTDRPVVWNCANNDIASNGHSYAVRNGIVYGVKNGAATVLRQPSCLSGDIAVVGSIVYNDEIYDVTAIGEDAFRDCVGLTSVEISSGVTSIDRTALRGCAGLTRVLIPDSVENIGFDAFRDCGTVDIYYAGELADWCGMDVAGNSAESDFSYGLYINNGLVTELVIPAAVTVLKISAFERCGSITSVDIHDGVTIVGASAFLRCSELASVEIGDGVTTVGAGSFSLCEKLESVTVGSSVRSILNDAFNGCKILSEIDIPNGVTGIGARTFYGCVGLDDIALPESLTSIGEQAFYGCTGLIDITVPDGVRSIGKGAFEACTNLESITVPFVGGSATATSSSGSTVFGFVFGESAHDGCESTRQYYDSLGSSSVCYYIPTSLKSVAVTGGNILYGAFYNCSNLTNIAIPKSVTRIDNCAFYNCASLMSISFDGTTAQWNAIYKGVNWDRGTGEYTVICADMP